MAICLLASLFPFSFCSLFFTFFLTTEYFMYGFLYTLSESQTLGIILVTVAISCVSMIIYVPHQS